jgi:hypothetical protein
VLRLACRRDAAPPQPAAGIPEIRLGRTTETGVAPITGSLPDIVNFVATPLLGGIPNPARVRGRAAIAQVARRRVRLEGDRSLARNVLRLLALDRQRRGE